MRKFDFITFDVETTASPTVAAQIVEIGAVRFRDDGVVLDQFQQLIGPGCDIPARVTEVHGITNQMVAGQPCIGEVLPHFFQFLGNTPPVVLLVHDTGFEVAFLTGALSRLG